MAAEYVITPIFASEISELGFEKNSENSLDYALHVMNENKTSKTFIFSLDFASLSLSSSQAAKLSFFSIWHRIFLDFTDSPSLT